MLLTCLPTIAVFVSKQDIGLGLLKNPKTLDEKSIRSKSTFRKWHDSTLLELDNTPVKNLTIVDTARRLTSNNVVFEIKDPRGFNLQISAENFYSIITKHTIQNGVIITGEYVWALNGNSAYLVEINSELYDISQRFEKEKKKVKFGDLKDGQVFYNKSGDKYIKIPALCKRYIYSSYRDNYMTNALYYQENYTPSSGYEFDVDSYITVLLDEVKDEVYYKNFITESDTFLYYGCWSSLTITDFVLLPTQEKTTCFSNDLGKNVLLSLPVNNSNYYIIEDSKTMPTRTLWRSINTVYNFNDNTTYYDLYLTYTIDGIEYRKLLSKKL